MRWVTNEGAIFCFSESYMFCEYWQYFNVDMWSAVCHMKQFTIKCCACYLWEIALNVGLDESFDVYHVSWLIRRVLYLMYRIYWTFIQLVTTVWKITHCHLLPAGHYIAAILSSKQNRSACYGEEKNLMPGIESRPSSPSPCRLIHVEKCQVQISFDNHSLYWMRPNGFS
jgi:hypothetical protein